MVESEKKNQELNELVNKWNAVGERLGESIDNINQLTLTIETPFNLANFQLEEIQSIIRTYFMTLILLMILIEILILR